MEKSDFLDLNLLSNNDYAGHWDVPVNESFTLIDEHAESIATELLAVPANGYIGQLRRTHASLEARLDTIEDGGLVFNDGDLEKSRYSRKPWTGAAEDINLRIAACEETEYVNDTIKRNLVSGTGLLPFVKRRSDRVSGAGPHKQKYATGMGVDLDNFYFRNISAASMITFTGPAPGYVTINGLGLMQISGQLFNHTRTCTYTLPAGNHKYAIAAGSEYAGATIDCQLIRDSVVTTHNGTFSEGSDQFDSTGIGAASVANNDWLPVAGQLLRISHGGSIYDYQIKTVDLNHLHIYGKFEMGMAGGGDTWEIVDLSQPCFTIVELPGVNDTQVVAEYALDKNVAILVVAYFNVDGAGNIRTTCPGTETDSISKYLLVDVDFQSTGHLTLVPGGTVFDAELDGISASNIKNISVIAIEQIYQNLATDIYSYVTSINPKRLVTIGGLDFFLDSFHVVHYGSIESNTGADILNHGTIGPGAGNTVIRLVHPDYGDDTATNTYWSYDPSVVACPQDGYALKYLGILVELV